MTTIEMDSKKLRMMCKVRRAVLRTKRTKLWQKWVDRARKKLRFRLFRRNWTDEAVQDYLRQKRYFNPDRHWLKEEVKLSSLINASLVADTVTLSDLDLLIVSPQETLDEVFS